MRISDWSSDVCSSDLGKLHADVFLSPAVTRLENQDLPLRDVAKNLGEFGAERAGAARDRRVQHHLEIALDQRDAAEIRDRDLLSQALAPYRPAPGHRIPAERWVRHRSKNSDRKSGVKGK